MKIDLKFFITSVFLHFLLFLWGLLNFFFFDKTSYFKNSQPIKAYCFQPEIKPLMNNNGIFKPKKIFKSHSPKKISSHFAATLKTQELSHDALLKILHEAIAAVQKYPESAQFLKEKGTVTIQLFIESDGNLSNISIAKSSGFNDLDLAALHDVDSIHHINEVIDYAIKPSYFLVDVVFL